MVTDDDIIGRVGRVVTAIRGGDKPGEVQFPFHGGSLSYIAYADVRIEIGSEVLAYDKRPGRAVDVIVYPTI